MLSRLVILSCLNFFISFLYTGCSDNSINTTQTNYALDTSIFTYPFKNGSTWNYAFKHSVSNIRPDSIRHYFSEYPVLGTGSTTILYDTVINGITTKCFLSSITQGTINYNNREYFGNYDSGLVCYGYRLNSQDGLTPYKISRGIHFNFKGMEFGSVYELFNYTEKNNRTRLTVNDTLYLEDPPVLCVKYPIVTGTQWWFKNIYSVSDIYKKYLGFEVMRIGTFFYSCMKTQRMWNSFNDLELYDYHSKYGMLKRSSDIKDVMVMNELGTILGYVDLNDMYEVTSLSLP